jgi:hypothetical protein
MGLTHAIRNDKHHAPKKGYNKGIKKERDQARRERAYARGGDRPK